MGLFDEIVGKYTGGTSDSSGQHGMVTSILEMLGQQQGGLAGLAASFQQKGLGDIVSSWIGTGQNLPISASQVQDVLGEQVRAFAHKSGISTDAAGSQLADLLPGIVDKLTPGGQIPQGGDLTSAGLGLLKNLMFERKADS